MPELSPRDYSKIRKVARLTQGNEGKSYTPARRGGTFLGDKPVKRGSLTVGRRELLPSKTAQTYEMLEKTRLNTRRTTDIKGSAIKDFFKPKPSGGGGSGRGGSRAEFRSGGGGGGEGGILRKKIR